MLQALKGTSVRSPLSPLFAEVQMTPESPGWDPPIITLRVVGTSYVFKNVFDRFKVLLRFKGGFTTSNGATGRFRYFLSYFRVF